jgi:excinuclease ABC subunit B
MRHAIGETDRRRALQGEFNRQHGITPQTVKKAIQESLIESCEADYVTVPIAAEEEAEYRTAEDVARAVARLRKEMREAAQELEFERAAELRDRLQHLEARELELRTGVRVS